MGDDKPSYWREGDQYTEYWFECWYQTYSDEGTSADFDCIDSITVNANTTGYGGWHEDFYPEESKAYFEPFLHQFSLPKRAS